MVITEYSCITVTALLFWAYLHFVWIKNADIEHVEENEKLY